MRVIVLNDLREIYRRYFSLYYLGPEIDKKFAVISLICYLTETLKKKKPLITYEQVIKTICKDFRLSIDSIKGLAILCEDFAYGCTKFPTFGIEDKKIPAKIRELLEVQLPF